MMLASRDSPWAIRAAALNSRWKQFAILAPAIRALNPGGLLYADGTLVHPLFVIRAFPPIHLLFEDA